MISVINDWNLYLCVSFLRTKLIQLDSQFPSLKPGFNFMNHFNFLKA